jgi:hypothetical protein
MIYLIIANMALLISFALYQLFFRKFTFFQWNRFYLLGAVVISFLIPIGLFIDLSSFRDAPIVLPTVDMADFVELSMVRTAVVVDSYSLVDLLLFIYGIGVLVSVGLLLYRAIKLREAFRQEAEHMSFSFFNRVFLGKHIAQEQRIVDHEWVHVKQRHSYDILLLELITVFNWFNPVLYWIRKEIKFQHECIADELCSEDKVTYAELLVANAMRVSPAALQHQFSNHSFLHKRIMMLFKNKSSKSYKLFYLAALPLLLVVVGSTLVFNTSKARAVVSSVEGQIHDVTLRIKEEPLVIPRAQEDELPEVTEEMSIALVVQQDTIKKGGRITQNGSAQSHTDNTGDELFTSVEINPMPKMGMDGFRRWIADPLAAIDAGVKGTITVSYIVEKDGKLSTIKILKDLGHGTGEAAVKLIEKAEPWNPGIQNGRAVRVAYTLPIRLDLTQMGGSTTYHATPELGYPRLRDWLSDAYQLPRKLTSADVDPYMYASFDVDEKGQLYNFKVKSDLEESFTAQFVRLLQNTKWNPEEENGIKQKSKGHLFVKFNRSGRFIRDYTRVAVLPAPKKGMDDFHRYIVAHVKYPSEMIQKGESGQVEVYFETNKDGSLGNFKVLAEPHKGIGDNVIEVLRKYGAWNPGIIDGQAVAAKYVLPVELGMKDNIGFIRSPGLKGREFIKK